MLTYEDVKNNSAVRTYIQRADESLTALGYTEHSFAHVTAVAENAAYILSTLGYPERTVELAKIAGFLHDIGNLVNRVDHSQSGAVMAFRILDNLDCDPEEIATIVTAIGNHDEGTGLPVNAVAAALILRKCYREDAVLTVPKTLRLDGGMAKRILGIGIPSAFENSLFEAGRILVVSMISTFGTVQIAANAVANNLDGMGVIPGKAIGLAMITVVGRCIGAGDHEQTVYYTRKLMLWAYITMGLSNGAILLFLRQLVGIYALSGETMELAITLVTIHAGCAIIFWPLSFVLPNALRAANDVKFTMVVSILSMACWRLGFSYLLCVRMGWGAVGVWVAMVIDWTCRVTCFVLRFRSGAWKTKYQA